jgi:hypothetical protein
VFYVLAVICFGAAIGMAFGIVDGWSKRDILSNPPVGKARITSVTTQYGRYGSSGRVYWRRDGESKDHWCSVPLRGMFAVERGAVVDLRAYTFLGSRREMVEPCARSAQAGAMRQIGFLGAGLVVALFGGIYVSRWASRRARVWREGVAATGRIVQVVRRGGKSPGFRVLYAFSGPGGELQGKASIGRRRAEKAFGPAGPQEGQAVDVVYDKDDPSMNELWGPG